MAREVVEIIIKGSSKQLRSELNKLESKTDATNKKIAKLAKVATVSFVVLAASVAKGVREFAAFESKFSDVVTLLDKGSFSTVTMSQGIEDLKDGVLRLGAESGQSFDELNKGLFDLISAGIPAEKAITTLAAATNLATAGATSVGIAVDGMTSALNAYELSADEAQSVSEKFFLAQKFGKTTVAELSANFGKAGATAAAFGVSLDELLASVAAATLGGIKTEAAFTGLNAILSNVAKPTAEAAAEAKRLGIEFNSTALRAKGLEGFLGSLTDAQNFNNTSIEKLFGSVEAQKVMFALTGSQADAFRGTLSALTDEQERAATVAEALAVKQETVQVKLDKLAQSWSRMWIQIGEHSKGGVDVATLALDRFSKGLDNVSKSQAAFRVNSEEDHRQHAESVLNMWERIKTFTIRGTRGVDKLEQKWADERSAAQDKLVGAYIQNLVKEEEATKAAAAKIVQIKEAEREKNRQIQEQALEEARITSERRLGLQRAFQELTAEERAMFSAEELAALESTVLLKEEAEKAALEKKLKTTIEAHNKELEAESTQQDALSKIRKIFESDQFSGMKGAFGDLAQLQNSENDRMKSIGKAAARIQILISTIEGATKAFNAFAWIPIVGPALGAAAAGVITAFGVEQIGKVGGMEKGGVVRPTAGGMNDRSPVMLQPGEGVLPRGLTQQIIGQTGPGFQDPGKALVENAALFSAGSSGLSGGGSGQAPAPAAPVEVRVGVDIALVDDAGELVTAQQRQDGALGISGVKP